MQQTLISVAWSSGRWRVTEVGPRNSIACFGERQDAMDYARELVEHTRDSSLLVLRSEQEPEAETEREPPVLRRKNAGMKAGMDGNLL